jgi:hypothetical protein
MADSKKRPHSNPPPSKAKKLGKMNSLETVYEAGEFSDVLKGSGEITKRSIPLMSPDPSKSGDSYASIANSSEQKTKTNRASNPKQKTPNTNMIQCPICSSPLNKERLGNHIKRVHKLQIEPPETDEQMAALSWFMRELNPKQRLAIIVDEWHTFRQKK